MTELLDSCISKAAMAFSAVLGTLMAVVVFFVLLQGVIILTDWLDRKNEHTND
jgi:predicted RND superfamily exporter protein